MTQLCFVICLVTLEKRRRKQLKKPIIFIFDIFLLDLIQYLFPSSIEYS